MTPQAPERAEAATSADAAPVRVGVDLRRLGPGGGHGGVKVLLRTFCGALAAAGRCRFTCVGQPALRPEFAECLGNGAAWIATGPDGRVPGMLPPVEVAYRPFGIADDLWPEAPQVALIVDLLHRDLPECLPPEEVAFREACFQRTVAQAHTVQTISRFSADRLAACYDLPAARTCVTLLPLHARLPEPAPLAPSSTPPVFFYPANFWPHKNHEGLLIAYRAYRAAAGRDAWPLALTGFPDERLPRLQATARALGLGDHVRFHGHVDETELVRLWRSAGVCVWPSLYEGFGIPLLEAMRFGVPLLAGRVASVPEVAGDAAEYVDPRVPLELAAGLARLASDAARRAELVRLGRARLATFSLEAECARLGAAFARAAGR